MENLAIKYNFMSKDGSQHVFDMQFDPQTLDLKGTTPEYVPRWTALDFNQCSHCPLTVQTHKNCPLALNLVDIVNSFDNLLSFDELKVEVVTDERIINQTTTTQRGISSLMGLVIATSGCPYTVFFRPMARFHLVVASKEETLYRAASMYMLAQYFVCKEGGDADLELKGLADIYKNIQIVNIAVTKRLRSASTTDSSINAVILLNAYAQAMPIVIENALEEIRHLFVPYLK